LFDIANESGIGFTSLPVNWSVIKRKIEQFRNSFCQRITEPCEWEYLLMPKKQKTARSCSTSWYRIDSGFKMMRIYHYHVSKVVHARAS